MSRLGLTSRCCGDGWDHQNIGRSLVCMHLPFGKGPNISSSPMPFGVTMPRKPQKNRWWSLYATTWLYDATIHSFKPLAICTMPHGNRLFDLYIYRGFC